MNIGFIGLGAMGSGIASNLLKAGHRLTVWNRSPGPAEALEKQGAVRAASPAEAFKGEAVFSMLAQDEAIRETILDSGALDAAPKGLVHVNMATVSVAFAKEMAEAHEKLGLSYVAAPVLGRPDVAAAGQLNILAAGPPEALERVRPLLDAVGKKVWPLGDEAFRANVVKLCANFSLAAAIETMAEGVALAQGHGISAADLIEVLTGTLFAAPAYKTYGQFIVDRQFEPANFKLTLGLKDVRLALAAGEAVHAPLPIASVLRDNFLDAISNGDADKDWAALAKVSLRRAGQS